MLRQAAIAIGALIAIVAVSAPVPAAAASSPPHASIRWHGCGGGFQCATVSVPVDWARPGGPRTPLALSRKPVADPSQRLGSLVINFGGPGDPGAETLRDGGADSLPAAVRARFDLVSFDPRGTGMSHVIACVDDATYDQTLAQDPTPDTSADLFRFYTGTNGPVDIVKACVDKQGSWLAQVGTRNTARDLERVRGLLGDQKLTFLGFSYGTALGAVYAQMYPDRVRALALDGAVNLSSTAASELHDNAVGFEQALDAFLADCAARTSCPYHHGGDPAHALAQLQQRFEAGLTLPVNDGRTAGATIFYLALASALYDRASWPFLARSLNDAEQGSGGDELAVFADSLTGRQPDHHFNHLQEALNTIRCDDRHDPMESFDSFRARHVQYSQQFPIFGAFLASSPLGCDPRLPAPSADNQIGDLRIASAAPILIVGTTGDPATPYSGAVDLQTRLHGSRLLTLVNTEHAGYAKGIRCVDNAVDRYLITRVLPPTGMRCHP